MAAMVAMVEESPRIPRSRAESAVRFPDVPNHAPVSKDKSKTNILKRSFWLNVIGSRDPQVQKPPQEAGSAAGSASAARPTNVLFISTLFTTYSNADFVQRVRR